jgi:hypothetical protein
MNNAPVTDQSPNYREQVLLDVAQDNGLLPHEAKSLPAVLDAFCRKLSMNQSETLWRLTTNKELASYAAGIARKVAIPDD